MNKESDLRILVIDDNTEVHQAFSKILIAKTPECDELNQLEEDLFGASEEIKSPLPNFGSASKLLIKHFFQTQSD